MYQLYDALEAIGVRSANPSTMDLSPGSLYLHGLTLIPS